MRYVYMATRPSLVVLALVGAAVFSVPALGQQSGGGLLNPGGEEAGEPLEEGDPAPAHWSTTGSFTTVDYGAPDFPGAAESAEVGGGARFFSGGRAEIGGFGTSTAAQYLDVSANAAAIDAGRVQIELAAAIGGRGSDPDLGTVIAQFADGEGAILRGTPPLVIGPVTAEERGGRTSLLPRSGTAPLPPGTRTIRVRMSAEAREGDYIDAFFDNVAVRLLGAETPPAPLPGGRPPQGGPDAGSGTGSHTGPRATLSTRPVRMTRSGVIGVRVTCRRGEPCGGRLLARTRRACGAARLSVPGGATRTIKLRLGRGCRREVARRRKGLPLRLELRVFEGSTLRATTVVRRGA